MAKNVNFELSRDEFFMMPISKIMVPLQSPSFLPYLVKFEIVLVTCVKHYLGRKFAKCVEPLETMPTLEITALKIRRLRKAGNSFLNKATLCKYSP